MMTNAQGFLWNILLALAWAAITGNFSLGNLVVGFGLGFLVMFVIRRTIGAPNYITEVRQVVGLMAFFIKEMIWANLRVAYDVLTPRHHMRPGIIAVPLDARTDAEITLLANMISLTPGTLSLDVSDDKKVLYLHAMYIDRVEEVVRDVKDGFERRLLEVMR